MAKVVGEDPTAVLRITHGNCGRVIEYTQSEVRNLWSGKDYGGGPDGADGFRCPHCGENIITKRW